DLVSQQEETRTSPGKNVWVDIFESKPTLVIIDEIAAHMRSLSASGDPDVRRQAEAIPSFLFNLFAAAAEVPTARVIITLATAQDAFGKETTEEIGRASCRERGERSGGAASARSRKTRGLATK